MLAAMIIKNEIISVILTVGCVLIALIILYRNLALMTRESTPNAKTGVFRLASLFNTAVLLFAAALILLEKTAVIKFTESNEKLFAAAALIAIILFGGFISPKLPFNRHTGLRLPWTVQDEDTWNIAHRIIGYISVPLVLLYLAAVCTIDGFEVITLVVMLLWIGVPGVFSLVFYIRKYRCI